MARFTETLFYTSSIKDNSLSRTRLIIASVSVAAHGQSTLYLRASDEKKTQTHTYTPLPIGATFNSALGRAGELFHFTEQKKNTASN